MITACSELGVSPCHLAGRSGGFASHRLGVSPCHLADARFRHPAFRSLVGNLASPSWLRSVSQRRSIGTGSLLANPDSMRADGGPWGTPRPWETAPRVSPLQKPQPATVGRRES
jgi:hypothetical protein